MDLKEVIKAIDELVEEGELGYFSQGTPYADGYKDGMEIFAAQLKAHFTNLHKQGYYNVT